ncbi:MAG TPA: hypothetical protein VGI85_12975 [Chthoniobacterales bacterium]
MITNKSDAARYRDREERRSKVKRDTIEQFMDTTKIGGSAFTYDERAILFHSNKSGIYNVYRVPIAGGAGSS